MYNINFNSFTDSTGWNSTRTRIIINSGEHPSAQVIKYPIMYP